VNEPPALLKVTKASTENQHLFILRQYLMAKDTQAAQHQLVDQLYVMIVRSPDKCQVILLEFPFKTVIPHDVCAFLWYMFALKTLRPPILILRRTKKLRMDIRCKFRVLFWARHYRGIIVKRLKPIEMTYRN
jgi:hypothetical protein